VHARDAQADGHLDPPAPPAHGAGDAIGAVVLRADDDAATRSQKLARIVLDEMDQFVGLLDAEGRTLEINRAALYGAGVQLDQICGQPFWEARWFQVSRETVQQTRDQVRRARAAMR
jgi:PAS domain-containing protein